MYEYARDILHLVSRYDDARFRMQRKQFDYVGRVAKQKIFAFGNVTMLISRNV